MADIKDLIRPPFANYDVVVYFGGGLFFVPFLIRYLAEPMGAKLPTFAFHVGTSITSEAVSLLSLLFCIYILGHLLAYLGSQIVEKTIDRYLGKVSTAIIFSSLSSANTRNEAIRSLVFDRIKKIKSDNALFSTIVRTIIHLPVIPHYIFAFITGIFGYYETRITSNVFSMVRIKYTEEIVIGEQLTTKTKWFKPLEYFVINRYPSAVPRMYNYLVISGLFRTLCLVFLFSSWMMLYYMIHFYFHGDWLVEPFFGWETRGSGLAEFIFISSLCVFCLFSYIKFQRRYAEETIMAAAFMKSD